MAKKATTKKKAPAKKKVSGASASKLKALQEQLGRVQGALDNSATASMHINNDLEITYANQATLDLVTENIDTFKKAFPAVDFSDLMGVCVDVFHVNLH